MPDLIDEVILVDHHDQAMGTCEKIEAHRKAFLHRAFSVFIFDRQDRLLLQRRSPSKYHSSGLWTNTCCGHPRPGEDTHAAAGRRLQEEMGLVCALREVFQYTYRADVPCDLTENEIVHVFFGISNDDPRPNLAEASDFRYADCAVIRRDLSEYPHRFTAWFALCFARVLEAKFGRLTHAEPV
jgi:isopentenyl-diphosphate Delta-isomerase